MRPDSSGRLRLAVGSVCRRLRESCDKLVKKMPDVAPNIPLTDERRCLVFSSGATGFPKAILHPHASLVFCLLYGTEASWTDAGRYFPVHPSLYHTGAKCIGSGSFLVGAKSVLLRGVKPRWILKAISDERATIVWLLVPWAQDILDAIESGEIQLSDYRLDQWRLMHIGPSRFLPA